MSFQASHDNAIRCPGTRANGRPCRKPLFFRGAQADVVLLPVPRNALPSTAERLTHTCGACNQTVEIVWAGKATSAKAG